MTDRMKQSWQCEQYVTKAYAQKIVRDADELKNMGDENVLSIRTFLNASFLVLGFFGMAHSLSGIPSEIRQKLIRIACCC